MITATPADTSNLRANYNYGYIWLISIVAALGGLLFGWDWVVIGGAKPFFERFFELNNPNLVGWANSCALVGCLVGSLVAGALSDRFGRKRLLMFSALLFAITSVGNGLAQTFSIFIAWRMLGGVAIGLASNLSPMYIAEVAPAQMRGRLVAINQLTIVVGILAAQSINYYLVRNLGAEMLQALGPDAATAAKDEFIRKSWFGQSGWRWMFGLTAIPSVLFLLGMLRVPESPRWLTTNGRRELAHRVLTKIGGESYATAAVADIESTQTGQETQHVQFRDLLAPGVKKMLVLGIVLAVFQQWCGINVIFNYAEEIFRAAGYDISDVLKNIAWTGSVNLAFTFVALGTVDRGGRRPLMLIGAAGLALIYTGMGFCYHLHVKGLPMLLLVLAAIGCYATSLAPVTWVVISEIFPNRIRGAAMSLAVSSLWIACFLLTYTFPLLNAKLGPAGTFWLYGAICVAGFIFILAKLPETKGKSLEQLERELVD
jgi:sugar porter (SP) family MFS transporter